MIKKNEAEVFEKMPVPQALATMAIPTIIGQIITLIYNLADTFYVGQTNNPYMVAGVSLILPIFNVLLALANLSSVGGGTHVSRLLGMGCEDKASAAASFSIWLGAAVALAYSLLTAIFMSPLLTFLGAGENTFIYAKQYVTCVIVYGAVPTVLANVLSNMLRSTGRSVEAGIGVALGGILNIILDPLFMYAILPKGNEVLGVGIATFMSNVISCIYYAVVLFRLRGNTVISLLPKKISCQSVVRIFYVGLPACFVSLMFDIDYMIIDKLMAGYSDIALAAIGIVLKAERLPLNIGIGISQGMIPLVAYNFASKNYDRMKKIYRLAFFSGIVCALICIAAYETFAGYIVNFLIDDAETVAIGTSFLRARSVATPFMIMSFFTVHLFQAFGKGGTALYLGFQRWVLLNIPAIFILNRFFGMYGIVWAQMASDTVNVIISFIILRHFVKKTFGRAESAQQPNNVIG
jgi:multidrug efflux pump